MRKLGKAYARGLFIASVFRFYPWFVFSIFKKISERVQQEELLIMPFFTNYDIGATLHTPCVHKKMYLWITGQKPISSQFYPYLYGNARERKKWHWINEFHEFNTICHFRKYMNFRGQLFLTAKLAAPQLILVQVDNFVLTMLEDSDLNKSVIEKYKLPFKISIVAKKLMFYVLKSQRFAPVVQRIERVPPKNKMQVQFLPGAPEKALR